MSGGRTKLGSWICAGVVLTLLAGCSSDDETPSPDPVGSSEPSPEVTDSPATAPAEVAWSADGYLQAVGVYEDVLITVAAGDPETMRGLDLATGEVLWETPSHRGTVSSSQLVMPMPIETATGEILVINMLPPVYDEAANFHFQTMRLLNPATGEVVKEYEPMGLSNPWQCAIVGSACMWALTHETMDQDLQLRINPQTLELEEWNDFTAEGYDAVRWHGFDVHAVQISGEEFLVSLDEDGEHWRTPTAEVLGEGAVATGEALVASHTDEDEEVLVLAGVFDPDQGGAQTAHVEDFVIGAVDVATGEPLWTREGMTVCADGVLCSGEVTFQRAAEDYWGTYDVRTGVVELMGVDYRTGEVKWINEPMYMEGISNGGTTAGFAMTPGALYLTLEDGTHTVNTETGEVTALADGYAPCYAPIVEDRPAWSIPGSELEPTWVGYEYYPCNDAGAAAADTEFMQEVVAAIEAVTWRPEAQQDEDLPTPRFRAVNTPQGLLVFDF